MTQNALATQNNEALWEGNGRQLFCTVLCYSKNKQLIIKDSLLCPWGKTALTFSLNSSRDYPEIFILLWRYKNRGFLIFNYLQQFAICLPAVKNILEPIPIPKGEQRAHLQEEGLVGKVRLIWPGKLTKLNQRSGTCLLPLLDFIKMTPFHLSILGNA